MLLTAGQQFAGYTIVRRLGAGGMGEVYLADHPRLPRRDALKLLTGDMSAESSFRERFLREADTASQLFHPHIVGVRDRGDEDGQLWIAMDFVDGEDVGSLIARRYPHGVPLELASAILTAVGSALDYAHKQNLLHRDVKPANILVTNVDNPEERRILLTDFGIARNTDDKTGLTATNMTLGTVDYAAPEQLMGHDLDGHADQYALAVTAYELLTGTPPFRNANPAVVIGQHINAPAPPLANRRPELAGLDPVLAIALAKEPAARFSGCGEFARAFADPVAHDSAAPTRYALPTPAAIGDGGAVGYTDGKQPPPLSPGWYENPDGRPGTLYWDGKGWHSVPLPKAAPPAVGRRALVVSLAVAGFAIAAVLVVSMSLIWSRHSASTRPDAQTAAAAALTPAGSPPVIRTEVAVPATGAPVVIPSPARTAVVDPSPPQQTHWSAVIVGTCDEGGTCGVKQRTAPYNAAPRLYPNPLMDGTRVSIVCQTVGDVRSSQGQGSSHIWYRLDNGAYVNAVYFDSRGAGLPAC